VYAFGADDEFAVEAVAVAFDAAYNIHNYNLATAEIMQYL
jgi:hypothetical protein